jgi:uncharacterized protein YjdB
MKRSFFILLSFLLVVTSTFHPETQQVNAVEEELLPNGDFETLTTGGAWKDNVAPVGTTTYSSSGSPVYAVDQNISHNGTNSASISASSTSRGALIQQLNNITVGETYQISGWMKTENISNKALVRFQIYRTGTSNTLVNIKELSGTNDWTYFERVVTIPEYSTHMKIETFLENSTGSLWIDDFSVKKVVELKKLDLTPSIVAMDAGETQVLDLTYTPSNTTQRNVTWSSSNESVAKVSEEGTVTALENGYTFVKATSASGNITSTAAVSVGASDTLTVENFSGTAREGTLSGQLIASDTNHEPIEFSTAIEPEHGVVNVRNDGSFVYYPEDHYNGEDKFVFMASTNNGGPKFGEVTIDVIAEEEAPELDLLWYSVGKNSVLEDQLKKVVYPHPEELVWAKVNEPSHGQLSVAADGKFQYTPTADYVGFDEFKVSVENPSGKRTEEKVSIFVLPDTADFVAQFTDNGSNGIHPRLLADEARFESIRSAIETDPYMKEWYELLKKQADAILESKPIAYDGGSSYGVIRDRLIRASLMYKISGDERYAQRAVQELDAISAYPNWYGRTNNMLPLSELSFGVALSYDWLQSYLTEEQNTKFENAIREKSLNAAIEWYDGEFKHNGEFNNINLVNNGGFTLAALAVLDKSEESEQAASQVLRGAYMKLQQTLRFYTEDGSWLEGPAYWHYGGQYLTYMMASMNNVLGTDYGLANLTGVKNSGEFPVYLLGEGGFFNFYDGNLSMAQPESMWFADYYNRADYAWHLGDLYRRKGVYDPLYLVFYKDGMFDDQPEKLDRTFRGIETISMRSGWNNPNALFAAMKGFDDTLLSHHDLDSGSFVFDGLGIRWASDLGNESYNLPGFWDYKHTRWTYYRKTTEGHNTIVVNPKENPVMQQQHDAKAMLIKSDSKPRGAYGILDMTDRYPTDAVSMKRGIMLTGQRDELILQDEMSFKKPSELYWFMHTASDIEIIENGKAAVLKQEDKKLYVKMMKGPEQAVFSEMEAKPLPTSPNPDGQSMNYGIKKLAVHLTNVEKADLSIWMKPLWDNEALPTEMPEFKALKDWTIPDGELIEQPERPEVTDLKVNGSTIAGFVPEKTYYEVIVPFDQEEVPLVEADSDHEIKVIPAEKLPGRTIVEVTDKNNPDVKNRYTILFENGPIEGELPAVNKWEVAEVTASAVPEAAQGNTPEKTIDGNLDTRWSAPGEQWIQYDLGSAKEVGAVSIAYMNGHQREYFFNIQGSVDGSTWTDLYEGQSSGMTIQPELFPFPKTTARYIRINSNGNTSNNWNSLTEVAIFRPAPIYLRVDAPAELRIGESTQITGTWVYADGRRVDSENLTFTSSDPKVIKIDENGKARALHFGKSTITVTDSQYGFEKMVEITVDKPGLGEGRDK